MGIRDDGPLLIQEGYRLDDAGYLILTYGVDFRDPDHRTPIGTLLKLCEKQYAPEVLGTMRISKPDQYRNHGETLISDPDEARVSRVTKYAEVVDDPHQLTEERLRADEANRAAEIAGARVTRTPKSTKRTRRNTDTLTSGKNGWIFCTAIAPSTPEEGERLWRSMSPKYDHASHIYRPRAFASALSSMVADQCGPQGSKMTMQVRFGDLSARCRRASQTVFHGPVVYAEDPYEVVTSAQSELEKILLPMFLKASGHGHADQREYRFVIWTNEEPRDPYVDLKIPSSMIGSMRERRDAPIENDRPFRASSSPSPCDSTGRLPGASQPAANDERDTLATVSVEEGLLPDVLDFLTDPATPVAPHRGESGGVSIGAGELTKQVCRALRIAVEKMPGGRYVEAASAAYHAEPLLRVLSEKFEDPVRTIAISDDNFVIIRINLHCNRNCDARIVVSPRGEAAFHMQGEGRRKGGLVDLRHGDPVRSSVIEKLAQIGVRVRREAD